MSGTVLVLSNHNPVLEEAVVDAGHDVVVVCAAPMAAARRATRPPYPVLSVPDWASYGDIARIAARLRGRVTQVATVWEGAMVAAGLVRGLLGLPGIDLPTAVSFTDKVVMKRRLAAAGVPVAGHRYAASVEEIPAAARELGGWPVIVKPLGGMASTHTHVLHDVDELAALSERLRAPLPTTEAFAAEPAFRGLDDQGGLAVEAFVDVAEEYHVDGLWLAGEPVYDIVGRYTVPPLRGMGGTLGSILIDPDTSTAGIVRYLAEQVARALGLRDGHTHAEILHTSDDRWLVGEIAARPGGGGIQTLLRHAYGIDTVAVLAAMAVGQPPDVRPRRAPGVYGWGGPAVPDGRVTRIATREALLAHPDTIDATVVSAVGGPGGATGSGLWGGVAGYVFLRGDTETDVLASIADLPARYAIAVTPTLAAARPSPTPA